MDMRCNRLGAGEKAFTLVELLVVIGIIGILASIAIGSFSYYINRAYNVTIRQDLKYFATAQEDYFAGNSRYLGSSGDYILGGNPATGPLATSEFKARPSEGVRIEIISGHGAAPQGPPAFIARADHERATVRYSYNFATDQLTEEDK